MRPLKRPARPDQCQTFGLYVALPNLVAYVLSFVIVVGPHNLFEHPCGHRLKLERFQRSKYAESARRRSRKSHALPTIFFTCNFFNPIEPHRTVIPLPKVMDIKPRMRANIVRLLHTSPGRVNVKARTHEKVDSVGEGRAMACHVVVLLEKNP